MLVLLIPVANWPPVSLILVAKLLPESTAPMAMSLVANNGNNIRLLTYILKWIWRKKCIYMLTLLPKGVQTKDFKLFWQKIFSNMRKSPSIWRVFKEKNWFMRKTWSRKSRGAVPLKEESKPNYLAHFAKFPLISIMLSICKGRGATRHAMSS